MKTSQGRKLKGRNLVVFRGSSCRSEAPTVSQVDLEELLIKRRRVREKEEHIAAALQSGARVEDGPHTAEFVREANPATGSFCLRLVVIVFMFVLLPGVGAARDINGDGRIDLAEFLESLFAAPAAAQDRTKTAYDKFEDKTTIETEIIPAIVALPDGSSHLANVPLTAKFACPGEKTSCSPDSIVLSYEAGARSLARCDSQSVIFIADDKRIRVGDCRWVGGVVVLFSLHTSDFTAISKAEHLQAKIGNWIFTFDHAGIEAMANLAKKIEHSAKE